MKKIFAFGLIGAVLYGVAADAAATRSTARTRAPAGQTTTTQSANAQSASGNTMSGTARRAPRAAVAQPKQNTSVQTAAAPAQRVNARAATTQKAINVGTKITGATTNTVVSEECKEKYYGCMDSFCMLDNASGGRCLCSDRHTELDKVLDEIQKLDEQSYAMATSGVERINMGADADAVQSMVDKITGDIQNPNKKDTRARTLNLDAWNNIYETDEMDVFGTATTDITNQTGDALHASVSDMCIKQIPECSANLSMLKLMYAQQIKSDCTAYENSLKKQRNESAKKLQTAQTALREAALEQHQNANKYDLGQCTIRFKQCMQSTAGCGDDFANCASVVATENAQTRVGTKNKKSKTYEIKTGMTSISIAASTYDILISKKPMCDGITKQCVSVQDQVWDTFLREVAPTLKSAELVAESNIRMNCIANISSCFQQACKDNMDPNDPDGSYDMCLSRPQTMRSLCRVQIDPCVAAEPQILDFVYARLASMRVDACTTEVKDCLTDENRCGSDYSKCIGLDLQSVRDMCPLDKLVACQKDGQAAAWETIDNIVQGIYLDIDNSLLTSCTNAVNAKMMEICGSETECLAFDDDEYIGTDSLTGYKARDGSFVIEGLLSFGNVKIKEATSSADDVKFSKYELDISGYSDKIKNVDGTSAVKDRVLSSLQSVQNKINQKIALLTSDAKISMCVNGRDMRQIRGTRQNRSTQDTARFPHLLDSQITAIIDAGLDKANENYSKKYDELFAKAIEQQSDENKSAMCAAMASSGGIKINKSENNVKSRGFLGLFEKAMQSTRNVAQLSKADFAQNDLSAGGASVGDYDVRIVLDGMTMNNLLNLQSSGKGEFIQKDGSGNMLGKITMSALYSADTNTCTLTTTTTMCENIKDVYNTSEVKSCGGGGFFTFDGCGGFSLFGGSGTSTTPSSTFAGTVCTKMAQPVITTQEIKM